AAHQLADLVGRARLALVDQADRRADLARRAVTALERVVINERLLERVQRAVARQAFDGRDIGAVGHHREGEAREPAPPTDQHRTGAALAVIAAFFRAGKIEVDAQRVGQGGPGRDAELALDAVHPQRDRGLGRRGESLGAGARRSWLGHGRRLYDSL